jgi:flavin-dependent dehydrogenase
VIGVIKEGREVKILTREGKTFKGTFVIAADGRSSRLARCLGLNQNRKFFGTAITMGYEWWVPRYQRNSLSFRFF